MWHANCLVSMLMHRCWPCWPYAGVKDAVAARATLSSNVGDPLTIVTSDADVPK